MVDLKRFGQTNAQRLRKVQNMKKKGGGKEQETAVIEISTMKPAVDRKQQFADLGYLKYPELVSVVELIKARIPDEPFQHELTALKPVNRFWVNDKGYVHYMTARYKHFDVGAAFRVVEIIKNADTGDYFAVLEIYDSMSGRLRNIKISTSISANDFRRLMCNTGNIVQDATLEHKFLMQKIDNAIKNVSPKPIRVYDVDGKVSAVMWDVMVGEKPIMRIEHSKMIGWDTDADTGRLVFKGSAIYTGEDTFSYYTGQFKIGENGEWDTYFQMIANEVLGNIPLEAALAFGASATVKEFLNKIFFVNLQNPIVHMFSDSTDGKSTTAMLIVSLGGQPIKGTGQESSLFPTLNGTSGSLIKIIGNNQGYPVCFDELGMSEMSEKEMQRVLFALTGGDDKKRLLRDGSGIQEGISFSTTIVTNGEQSLIPNNSVRQGIITRVFEFPCVTWTDSAKQAKIIQRVTSQNYGFITPMLAQYLLRMNEEQRVDFKNKYDGWVEKTVEQAEKQQLFDKYTERLAETLALFMVSLEFLGEIINVPFHLDKVFDFLFRYIIIEKAENSRIGDRAYEYLLDTYNKNPDAFWNRMYSARGGGKQYVGVLIDNKHEKECQTQKTGEFKTRRCIGLTKEQAENLFVETGKFSDVKVIMKAFNKMGVLSCKNEGYETAPPFLFNKYRITNGYQVYIPEDADDWDFYEDE